MPTGATAAYRAAPLWQNFATIIEDVASGTAGALTWVLTSDGTLTISGTGDMPDFSRPSYCAPWNDFRNSITAVVIDYGVTSIGNYAFYDLIGNSTYPALTQAIIPNSVTRIGKTAFYKCIALTSVTIPNSVTSIESAAFASCEALTSITIPNSVTSIEPETFNSCKALTSFTIPNSVTSIGERAFINCIKLESVTIGYGVTSIGCTPFAYCSALTKLSIKALTPPDIPCDLFNNVTLNSSCVLEVPFGSKNLYRASYYWNYFTTINEITDPDLTSSVVSASVASSTSITINGRITNSSPESKSANMYFIYGTDPNNLTRQQPCKA